MLLCENHVLHIGAYFLAGKRVHVRCEEPATVVCVVNPYRPDKDGTVCLCDLCDRFNYYGFAKWELPLA